METVRVIRLDQNDQYVENAASANWKEHPDAGIFNMLEGKDYESFRDGIKEAGAIFEPVDIVWADGSWQLADGRKRRVAQELGFPLKVHKLPDDTDVKAHVIGKNLHRRHLSPAQLAYFAANMVTVRRGDFHGNQYTRDEGDDESGIGNFADTTDSGRQVGKKGRTVAEAAEMTGLSPRTIQDAIHVKDHDPKAFEDLKHDKTTPSRAAKESRAKKDGAGDGDSKSKSKPKTSIDTTSTAPAKSGKDGLSIIKTVWDEADIDTQEVFLAGLSKHSIGECLTRLRVYEVAEQLAKSILKDSKEEIANIVSEVAGSGEDTLAEHAKVIEYLSIQTDSSMIANTFVEVMCGENISLREEIERAIKAAIAKRLGTQTKKRSKAKGKATQEAATEAATAAEAATTTDAPAQAQAGATEPQEAVTEPVEAA